MNMLIKLGTIAAAAVVWAASSLPSSAVPYTLRGDLGSNPDTAIGRTVGAGHFEDAYTFSLDAAIFFDVSASATNSFANPAAKINLFDISVYSLGVNGVFDGGNFDDVLVLGPSGATPTTPNNQQVSIQGILAAGKYFVGLTGNGAGAPAKYAGTVSTFAVPGPVLGAGLPGLVLACGGLLALARRRRRKVA
jgi:hypothetical protein